MNLDKRIEMYNYRMLEIIIIKKINFFNRSKPIIFLRIKEMDIKKIKK